MSTLRRAPSALAVASSAADQLSTAERRVVEKRVDFICV